MKPKYLLLVLYLSLVPVWGFPTHAEQSGDIGWLPTAVDKVLAVYDRESVLVIGELHGTEETPALAAAMAQRLAGDASVVLALEVPRQEQQSIDAFLDSQGNPEARAKLLSGEFWRVDAASSDGRRSRAMVALLETVRAARQSGLALSVATLDDMAFHAKGGERRQGMAKRIVELAENPAYEHVVALVGNYHARLAPPSAPVTADGEALEDPPVPTAALITDVPLISVNVTACSGSFWSCRAPGSCGPIELPGQCPEGHKVQVMEIEPNDSGYHVVVVLGQLTPSPPASHCAIGGQYCAATQGAQ